MLRKGAENFEQFLDFVTYFCTELAAGTSPEYALVRSVQQYGKQSPSAFTKAARIIERGESSFAAAWKAVIRKYEDNRYRRIVELLGRFMKRGARIGGERMLEVLKQIRINLALANKRKSITRAQRVKVVALSLTASAVLGMAAGVLPIIAIAFQDPFWLSQPHGITELIHMPYLVLMLFLTSTVSTYRLTQATGTSLRIVIVCSLIFVMTFTIITSLLTTLP